MFVQYSFVQRRASPARSKRREIEMTPATVMAAGIGFMAITSILFLVGN